MPVLRVSTLCRTLPLMSDTHQNDEDSMTKPFSLTDPEISRWLANFIEPEDSLRNPAIVPREMLVESGYTLSGAVLMSPKTM